MEVRAEELQLVARRDKVDGGQPVAPRPAPRPVTVERRRYSRLYPAAEPSRIPRALIMSNMFTQSTRKSFALQMSGILTFV